MLVDFECVTNNRHRVLSIALIKFGARSDKHIVGLEPTVSALKTSWYKNVEREYYNIGGELKRRQDTYFICDGGFLCWQTLVCPYAGTAETGRRGHYNTNLESVRKDVECTFGIQKKRW